MTDVAKSRPNILWITTDQQRFDTIGALGNAHVRTPNIDRLVKQGTAFTHAYCQNPICTPSRSSFLTGMYPSSVHGCTNGNEGWADAAPLVTKLLADSGYDVGLVGKLHLAACDGRIEPRYDDGYRLFEWSHSPRDKWQHGHAYADWLRENGVNLADIEDTPTDIPVELRQTSWIAERSAEFIENHLQAPWLLSVNMYDPHPRGLQFDPPQELLNHFNAATVPPPAFRESDLEAQARLVDVDFQTVAKRPVDWDAQNKIAGYYGLVELVDIAVGRLLDTLERTDQLENTLIIFTSDHGEMLGDHGLFRKGCRFYEGLVRVPLIFAWSGCVADGLQSDALVELIDIAPTLLDIAGVPAPRKMQGKSLLPLLNGREQAHRDSVRCEYYHSLSLSEKSDWHGSYATMLRNRRFKLVTYHGTGLGELFDLHADPHEFENLWDSADYQQVKYAMMLESFDQLAAAVDLGTPQTFAH